MIMTEPSVAASSSESPAGPVRISEMLLVCSEGARPVLSSSRLETGTHRGHGASGRTEAAYGMLTQARVVIWSTRRITRLGRPSGRARIGLCISLPKNPRPLRSGQ